MARLNVMVGQDRHIRLEDPLSSQVIQLLREHHQEMFAHSPPESVHALDESKFNAKNLTFWGLYDNNILVGCGALLEIDKTHGEIKAMRTVKAHLRQGVGQRLLQHIIQQARSRSYQRLSLETGSMAFFSPARAMYERHGFTLCRPFANYSDDPHSVCMTLNLAEASPQ